MSDLDRLSPYNIRDALIRSRLYAEIRAAQELPESSPALRDWKIYEVSGNEANYPELVALRALGRGNLKWVVCIAAGLDDWRQPLPLGQRLRLPSLTWLRDAIRAYMAMERP